MVSQMDVLSSVNLLEALPAVGGVDIVPLLLHGGQDALDPLDVAADVVLAQRLPLSPLCSLLETKSWYQSMSTSSRVVESIRTC